MLRYSLEAARRGASYEYPRHIFCGELRIILGGCLSYLELCRITSKPHLGLTNAAQNSGVFMFLNGLYCGILLHVYLCQGNSYLSRDVFHYYYYYYYYYYLSNISLFSIRKYEGLNPAGILYKSTAGHYRPVSYPDGPITARCRFIKNAYWEPDYTCVQCCICVCH